MVTLTYPGGWLTVAPDPETVANHRQPLDRRYERATGHRPAYPWKREFQRRGAPPHLHLAGVWPADIEGERLETWVSLNWYEIVGSDDPAHLKAGTGVDWAAGHSASDIADWAGTSEEMVSRVYRHRLQERAKLRPADIEYSEGNGSRNGSR